MDDWLPLSRFLGRQLWLVSCYLHPLLVCCILFLFLSCVHIDRRSTKKKARVFTPAAEGQGQIFLSDWLRGIFVFRKGWKTKKMRRQWLTCHDQFNEYEQKSHLYDQCSSDSLLLNLLKCLMLTYVFMYGFTLTHSQLLWIIQWRISLRPVQQRSSVLIEYIKLRQLALERKVSASLSFSLPLFFSLSLFIFIFIFIWLRKDERHWWWKKEKSFNNDNCYCSPSVWTMKDYSEKWMNISVRYSSFVYRWKELC